MTEFFHNRFEETISFDLFQVGLGLEKSGLGDFWTNKVT